MTTINDYTDENDPKQNIQEYDSNHQKEKAEIIDSEGLNRSDQNIA